MNQIKEEKSLIAYTIRVRKPGKAKPDSIYVFGNSPDEFVQNLRQQLRGRGYNDLNDVSAKLIKRNLQKQVQQFSDLSFANERIDVSEEILIEEKSMKNTELKKLIKEEIQNVLNEAKKINTTLKFVDIVDDDWGDESAVVLKFKNNPAIDMSDGGAMESFGLEGILSNSSQLERQILTALKPLGASQVSDVWEEFFGMGEEGEYNYFAVFFKSPVDEIKKRVKTLSLKATYK